VEEKAVEVRSAYIYSLLLTRSCLFGTALGLQHFLKGVTHTISNNTKDDVLDEELKVLCYEQPYCLPHICELKGLTGTRGAADDKTSPKHSAQPNNNVLGQAPGTSLRSPIIYKDTVPIVGWKLSCSQKASKGDQSNYQLTLELKQYQYELNQII